MSFYVASVTYVKLFNVDMKNVFCTFFKWAVQERKGFASSFVSSLV